jgi:phospholipase C
MHGYKIAMMILFSIYSSHSLADKEIRDTRTPIKNLIIIIGENFSFENLFATYNPAMGQSILNLRSQAIVKSDGKPDVKYYLASQSLASNRTEKYTLTPTRVEPYRKLPPPKMSNIRNTETLLPYGPIDDPRFADLKVNGPFQITDYVPQDALVGDPPHRFFQMWQATGGDNEKLDLYAWVASTVGLIEEKNPKENVANNRGGELMGFYNLHNGDLPYFRSLADRYTISDNFHQPVMGGTGTNFIALVTGDVIYESRQGSPIKPRAFLIENVNPIPGSDNLYRNDSFHGGSFVNCSDLTQPGVEPIVSKLAQNGLSSGCDKDTYYLVNALAPPFDLNGDPVKEADFEYEYSPYTVPTIAERMSENQVSWGWFIGGKDDVDIARDDAFRNFILPAVNKKLRDYTKGFVPERLIEFVAYPLAIYEARDLLHNRDGNPLSGSVTVMANPELRSRIQSLHDFEDQLRSGNLPAVSFIIPANPESGHPAYSIITRFERFVEDMIGKITDSPQWNQTAVIVLTDETGGYFDSGPIQMLDFFGDGPRVPLFVVSPYSREGVVDHNYLDHASILKFIEFNWNIPKLSGRSRDNLPNPIHKKQWSREAYIPVNRPAIGDMTTLFDFSKNPKGSLLTKEAVHQ